MHLRVLQAEVAIRTVLAFRDLVDLALRVHLDVHRDDADAACAADIANRVDYSIHAADIGDMVGDILVVADMGTKDVEDVVEVVQIEDFRVHIDHADKGIDRMASLSPVEVRDHLDEMLMVHWSELEAWMNEAGLVDESKELLDVLEHQGGRLVMEH